MPTGGDEQWESFATEFENGQSFVIDDLIEGAWFVVPSNTNGLPDEDGRVLLAQLTTDGDLDGVLYMQVLPGGVGTLAQIMELPLYGDCDEIALIDCPEAIEAVEYGGCEWGFEVSNFQAGETATWTFGDDVVSGGHYAEYVFGGDGVYPVTVSFSSDVCPEGSRSKRRSRWTDAASRIAPWNCSSTVWTTTVSSS